jgi:F-type H+-transporting ATPase subunit b
MSSIASGTLLAAESNPLVPHVSELIVGTIAFVLLLAFLWKAVYPRFETTYEARVQSIEGGIAEAERKQAEASELLEQYKAQLSEARSEAAAIREKAHADGARILEELRAEGQEQKQRIVQSGEETLAAERERLIADLRSEIGTLAVDLASRIVGESLADEARRSGSVDRFLGELESGAAGGRR